MKNRKNVFLTFVLVMMTILSTHKVFAEEISTKNAVKDNPNGWWLPFIGSGRGQWETSLGIHLWNDHLRFRNLQFRGNVDISPGFRLNAVIRSDREFNTLGSLAPKFDELYFEKYGFYHTDHATFSASLRVGNMRYLRFPYPDLLATFDQVPGTEDLRFGTKTGYRGELLVTEYAHESGFGHHLSLMDWRFSERRGTNIIENYAFYRNSIGHFDFETRTGNLQIRPEPLGRSKQGFNVYLGTNWKGYKAGILYEKLHNQPAYTGVMVTFAPSTVTKTLGSIHFDYNRAPQGIVFQLPLAKGNFGNISERAPDNSELVGEIKAERMITYWQNGQGRNFYEHRLSQWGQTEANNLILVVEEGEWYLQLESLVSPHTSFKNWDDLVEWEKKRQGPAQLSQQVTYKFYKVEQ